MSAVAPAVVDDGIVAHGVVVPRNQFGGVPLLGTVAPFAIGEEYGRLVARDEFLELRNHVRVDVGANVLVGVFIPTVDGTGPFGQGVIETHLDALFAHGFCQFTADVAMRPDIHGVPVGRILAWPEAEAVVVLRYQKHIFCS